MVENKAAMSAVQRHRGQSVRAVTASATSVIAAKHMSTRAATHRLLMEHKTEVDLLSTAGRCAALAGPHCEARARICSLAKKEK